MHAQTLEYYASYAEEYARRTLDVDLTHLYEAFLPLVPDSGRILDAGNGSGRDTLHFLKAGYRVTAFDAVEEMTQISSNITGQRTLHCEFHDISFAEAFDGVWANASLLHVPPDEIDDVIERLTVALKPEGVLFCSFKRGEDERTRDERYFNCYTEEDVIALLARHPQLEGVKLWTNSDARRANLTWLNVLARRAIPRSPDTS